MLLEYLRCDVAAWVPVPQGLRKTSWEVEWASGKWALPNVRRDFRHGAQYVIELCPHERVLQEVRTKLAQILTPQEHERVFVIPPEAVESTLQHIVERSSR